MLIPPTEQLRLAHPFESYRRRVKLDIHHSQVTTTEESNALAVVDSRDRSRSSRHPRSSRAWPLHPRAQVRRAVRRLRSGIKNAED